MSVLTELTEIATHVDNPFIREWKAQGRKSLGFLCSHVPEEIIFAAGVLPYRLRAPGCTQTAAADVYMGHVNCTFVRSCLQFIYEEKYDFLDGFICTNSCDHSRRLYDLLRETTKYPFVQLISVPHKVGGEEMVQWYKGELFSLKENLEKAFGLEITDERLTYAIEVYNESRSLLRQLYEMRKKEEPPIAGAETLNVVLAASSMPRDQYNKLLKKLLVELSKRDGISGHRARVMVSGSGGCDDPAYLKAIEDVGCLIVTDTLCFGSRYFWQPVEFEGDLMLGLARSYLKRPSCANMTDMVAERFEFIRQMAADYKVDGVVFQRIRYCDLWGGQLLYIREKAKESNLRLLSLEREYRTAGVGQLRTRVQAFLESIQ
jgi:benzoyl-CoA reductase subunit C